MTLQLQRVLHNFELQGNNLESSSTMVMNYNGSIKRTRAEPDQEQEAVIFKKPRVEGSKPERSVMPYQELSPNYESETRLKMVSGSFYLPKENELRPQGEDAHFICAEENTIGVADGVGGWANKGIDSGLYARELMMNSVMAVHNQHKTSSGVINPRKVLEEAFSNTKNIQGSSTACIVTLNKDVLHYANVGDSGFMLFRNNKCLFRSSTQQHRFNCPFQLGNAPRSDHPSSATGVPVRVIPGDVIVLGTDGLLDNMFGREIEQVLEDKTDEGDVDPEMLAGIIAELALYNSFDRFNPSPFSVSAKKAGVKHVGGKVDDITVIVAAIMEES
ncbi:probable protein phosphatase 2C 55 [Rosa rugosa]|uniref:probable protein phosphatase 2C 55 n=1 Tax=Rosa rugosa TaxID=74645 RepID=UPI002B41741C|nr:probable protein phosphatase 2C 55 [Rosa rugosa]